MASAWGLNFGTISGMVKLQATSAICSCCCRPVACRKLQLACCAKLLLNFFVPVALTASRLSGDSLIRASPKSRPAHGHVLIYQAGQNPTAPWEHRAGASCDEVGMPQCVSSQTPEQNSRLIKLEWPCSTRCSYAVPADSKHQTCAARQLDPLARTFLLPEQAVALTGGSMLMVWVPYYGMVAS